MPNNSKVFPKKKAVDVGKKAIFLCQDSVPESVRWFHTSKFILPKKNSIETGPTLAIPSISHGDYGYYFCYGKSTENGVPYLDYGTLIVYGMILYLNYFYESYHLAISC